MYFHFTWHESPGFDIFFSFFSSPFSIPFFFVPRRQLSTAAWRLRHRLHSYNIGDNLLCHLVAPEASFLPIRRFEPYGRLTFLASIHSRHSVSSASTPMLCISQDLPYSSSFQFTFRSPSTRRGGRNISGMRPTTRL
jgi:hypothetical protein